MLVVVNNPKDIMILLAVATLIADATAPQPQPKKRTIRWREDGKELEDFPHGIVNINGRLYVLPQSAFEVIPIEDQKLSGKELFALYPNFFVDLRRLPRESLYNLLKMSMEA